MLIFSTFFYASVLTRTTVTKKSLNLGREHAILTGYRHTMLPIPFFLAVVTRIATLSPGFGGFSALHHAVIEQDGEKIRRLTREVPFDSQAITTFLGQSALHFAVLSPGILDQLIDCLRDETFDIGDARGTTPLMYAAAYGQVRSFRMLLDQGADPFLLDQLNFMSAWDYAVVCRNDENSLLDMVIQFGETAPEEKSLAALCMLARVVVQRPVLYSIGFFKNLCSFVPPDLLLDFAWRGNRLSHLITSSEQLEALIDREPSLAGVQNVHGYTPAMIAAHCYRSELLPVLLNRKTSIKEKDEHGMNAMHHLVEAGLSCGHMGASDHVRWLSALRSLISAGIDLGQGDDCQCPCSRNGCSSIRALLWREGWDKLSTNFSILPWLLEVGLMVSHLCSRQVQIQAVADLYRIIRFEELHLTHSCCRHATSTWNFDLGSRVAIRFTHPLDDLCRASTSSTTRLDRNSGSAEELELDRMRIREEESELSQRLESDCTRFLDRLVDPPGLVWSKLVGRRADFLRQELISLGNSDEPSRFANRSVSKKEQYKPPRYSSLKVRRFPRAYQWADCDPH